ncbi:envelope stress response membrane protein PspB [Enterovibrio nigricans]|uniref:Phage shock protein B n=1 Tax=Enterovibrio nigricans DSM 22720 TaxID=1121868 RepID=A0A1T4U4U9_9GAMM|nr:envelope stress response membrane protein PspB [Enterovibrio nigricans]PKF50543.1 envelope stress response membrane protein PspB [Enterovibrio nigricans]SKA47782.1 phage shock protein B [Enterovibrio nigricans DSM 22720]
MSMAFLSIPLVVFLVFVAPLWLWLHYRSKRQVGQGLSSDEFEQLQALADRAEVLQSRIESLERILDEEAPNWRHKQ